MIHWYLEAFIVDFDWFINIYAYYFFKSFIFHLKTSEWFTLFVIILHKEQLAETRNIWGEEEKEIDASPPPFDFFLKQIYTATHLTNCLAIKQYIKTTNIA